MSNSENYSRHPQRSLVAVDRGLPKDSVKLSKTFFTAMGILAVEVLRLTTRVLECVCEVRGKEPKRKYDRGRDPRISLSREESSLEVNYN